MQKVLRITFENNKQIQNMQIQDFINKLRFLKNRIPDVRRQSALKAGLNLSALIKLRIQTKGENSDNRRFVSYTAPYAKTRKKQGYQTDIVDFTKTGALMNNIQPQIVSHDNTKTVVNIGARALSNQLILRGQVRKRGNILLPSKSELAIVEKEFSNDIVKNIRQVL